LQLNTNGVKDSLPTNIANNDPVLKNIEEEKEMEDPRPNPIDYEIDS
jgi:hypothetical protein